MKKIINDMIFLWQFAIDDFKAKYAGSALGAIWAFVQPLITIGMYWFVFQMGFKSQPVDKFPFILWLLAGLVPWFFISDTISNATTSMVSYSYLVKKVLFNINILPLAKVVSMGFVQIALLAFMIIVYALCGYMPDMYYLQLIIYIIYMVILVTGISYLTATLYVFFRDVLQLVSVALQVLFWGTPIVWSFESINSPMIEKLLSYNPFYYVVNGYRNVFIYKNGMGTSAGMTVYYWIVALFVLLLGVNIFSKCKNHFADIL